MRGWPWWVWALAGAFVVGLVVAAIVVWRGDGARTAASATRAAAESSTMTPTPSAAIPATAGTGTTTDTATPTMTATPAGSAAVPGAVVAAALSSGGSGEVRVEWNAVPEATGYRVLRTGTDGGDARNVADFNITTGGTTAAAEVVNIWSAEHDYLPDGGPRTTIDPSAWFKYIDVGDGERCYRVVAYNAVGDGPPSPVTCGSPPAGDPRPSSGTPTTSY